MQKCSPRIGTPNQVKQSLWATSVLSIAGFDPSSGAGVTADLKVFAAHGLYGLACPTALTVQSTQGVRRSEPVNPSLIVDTLSCLREDIALAGVKIGMLGDVSAVEAVVRWLGRVRAEQPDLPVVLDPVMRSSSGAELLSRAGLLLLQTELLPLVSLITPNLAEAATLVGMPPASAAEAAARALQRYVRGGAGAVVVTGGDSDGAPNDLLLDVDGRVQWFGGERVHTRSTHGTGCAFSSALLANLVHGRALPDAVGAAKEYVRGALVRAYPIGKGRGPIDHYFSFRTET